MEYKFKFIFSDKVTGEDKVFIRTCSYEKVGKKVKELRKMCPVSDYYLYNLFPLEDSEEEKRKYFNSFKI
mgnify:CR=1 FL=1